MKTGEELPKIIILTGPTCSGKSALAIEIAQVLGGEIINADSMQVYSGMDIGTAKLSISERKTIPHHLIDIIFPDQDYNAALFRLNAFSVIEKLHSKNKVVIIAGGTGLYIKALTGGLFDCPPGDPKIRQRLLEDYEKEGLPFLYKKLSDLDIKAANNINKMDKVRIIRALEVIYITGKQFSGFIREHGFSDRKFNSLKLCIDTKREELYDKINRRTASMFDSGLVKEVEGLLKMGYSPELKPMQAFSYKHVTAYLQGKEDLDGTIRLIQRDTRRYAKRQLTWFRADPEISWVKAADKKDIINKAISFIER